MIRALALAAILSIGAAFAAAAQGVDRYEYLELKKKVEQALDEMERLRNAMAGGNIQQRFSSLEDELSRLIGEVERLEFSLRQHEEAARKKLEDLEYRIIVLEGGDPSTLFQSEEPPAPAPRAPQSVPQIQPSPGGAAVQSRPLGEGGAAAGGQPGGSQTLGVLNRPVTGAAGAAGFEQGVAAMQAGRAEEARDLLESFLSANPDSPVAGDAYFWLGEAYYSLGDFRQAARRYVDGAELHPGSPTAPRSLLKLGVTLSILGQTDVACRTLRAVGERYPNSTDAVSAAETEARRAGCG